MTAGLPAGFVDPADSSQVAAVLQGTLERLGLAALVDLLTKVPGLAIEAGRPAGRFRAAEPAVLQAGQHRLLLGARTVREHVVGGIVLRREPVPVAELPVVLARIVSDSVAGAVGTGDASVALTAVRDTLAAMG